MSFTCFRESVTHSGVNLATATYNTEAGPASEVVGAISVISGSQVSSRLRYRKRDEVYFTALL